MVYCDLSFSGKLSCFDFSSKNIFPIFPGVWKILVWLKLVKKYKFLSLQLTLTKLWFQKALTSLCTIEEWYKSCQLFSSAKAMWKMKKCCWSTMLFCWKLGSTKGQLISKAKCLVLIWTKNEQSYFFIMSIRHVIDTFIFWFDLF